MSIDFAKDLIQNEAGDEIIENKEVRQHYEAYRQSFSTLAPDQKAMVLKLVQESTYLLLRIIADDLDGPEEGGQFTIKIAVPSVNEEEYSINIAPSNRSLSERLPEWIAELTDNGADFVKSDSVAENNEPVV